MSGSSFSQGGYHISVLGTSPCFPIVLVTMGARSHGQSSKVDSWFTHAVKQVKSLHSCSQGDINAKKCCFDFLNLIICKEESG